MLHKKYMEISDRNIMHIDLDSFFVSVERLQNSKIIGKPVIIGGMSDRGVVSSCSYEARRFGVHSAMPMKMARQLCHEAFFIRGDMDLYTKHSQIVTEIIAQEAPVYEKASIDEHYIDITGMDKFFGSLKWSHELRQKIIKNSGLPISFGLSLNKTVSKIATGEAKPNGELHIQKEQIRPFLNPLSIRKIPMLGNKTYQLLRSMGVSTIKTLSMIPVEMMENAFGKNGVSLWKKANGIDSSSVQQYSERKSISRENTFERDTTDIKMLNTLISAMVEKLAFDLRRKEKLTSCITIKIRYSNFDTHTLQKRISYTSFDHTLIKIAKELFLRLYTRRMLIRLIGVKFSHLVGGVQQLNMFEDTIEMVSLYKTMDNIRKRYGADAVKRVAGI
jgi:DNA polymerase-4